MRVCVCVCVCVCVRLCVCGDGCVCEFASRLVGKSAASRLSLSLFKVYGILYKVFKVGM